MRQRLAQQGLDLETYYKMRKTDAASSWRRKPSRSRGNVWSVP